MCAEARNTNFEITRRNAELTRECDAGLWLGFCILSSDFLAFSRMESGRQ
jgi:hypothetical protein